MSIPYIKNILLTAFLLTCFHAVFATTQQTDSLNITLTEQKQARPDQIDSLKHELDAIVDDSLKAPYYTQIAAGYMKYDTVANKKQRHVYQNLVISNTMSALHYYSRYNDTIGLR